ncbi:MAG: hypothetical protein HC895_13305 [Leptolyngbyaceae cyanobacterium SM1_3_5]|nr:hypothetical protein [Leptolyngbyaceae cyanobacterium SM1_3_5]
MQQDQERSPNRPSCLKSADLSARNESAIAPKFGSQNHKNPCLDRIPKPPIPVKTRDLASPPNPSL